MMLNPWKPVFFVCVCRNVRSSFLFADYLFCFQSNREKSMKKKLVIFSVACIVLLFFLVAWSWNSDGGFFPEMSFFFVVDSHSIVTSRNKQDKNWSKDIEKKIVRFELFKTHTNGLWPTSKTDRHTLKT